MLWLGIAIGIVLGVVGLIALIAWWFNTVDWK